MLKSLLVIAGLIIASITTAQGRFFTKTGNIAFYSKTKVEDIEAHNRTVTCVLDTKTNNIQFAVLMKGFEFKKALMQEHFNENYVESDKYPKAEFKGQVIDNGSIDYTKPGTYAAKVRGQMTIHGQTKEEEAAGTITVRDGKIITESEFQVSIDDYKISVPALVKDKISRIINVKVSCSLEPLK